MVEHNFENLLLTLARGGSIDHEQWPALQPNIIETLEKTVKTVFTSPASEQSTEPLTSAFSSSPPNPEPSSTAETSSQNSSSSTQSTNKENAPPPTEPAAPRPSQNQLLFDSIVSTLNTYFTKHPPHTIQRLSELILWPKQHYKTLPSYLHAVDRVVHVTSGAQIFPLPPAIPDPSSSAILSNGGTSDPLSISWGNPATTPAQVGLGSDESLGGALLTPISWLQPGKAGKVNGTHSPLEGEVTTESTEMIDGPNGVGGIETVTVSVNGISSTRSNSLPANEGSVTAELRAEGGITQGELLRQEQRAGVVPVSQLANRGNPDGTGEEDDSPHARGPDEIGPEDIGTQHGGGSERVGVNVRMQGIDVQAALGRKTEPATHKDEKDEDVTIEDVTPETPKRLADEDLGAEKKRIKEGETDADGDAVLVDADGKTEDEPKFGEAGESKGADAIDTTTV
ncbi:hypothetical protein B0O99DRAFT_685564 [Bisporella sp. PMI_857]|nr:hypothetical protein B0O99DRAFT_685564 [Bisporella sp. PMI_857]